MNWMNQLGNAMQQAAYYSNPSYQNQMGSPIQYHNPQGNFSSIRNSRFASFVGSKGFQTASPGNKAYYFLAQAKNDNIQTKFQKLMFMKASTKPGEWPQVKQSIQTQMNPQEWMMLSQAMAPYETQYADDQFTSSETSSETITDSKTDSKNNEEIPADILAWHNSMSNGSQIR